MIGKICAALLLGVAVAACDSSTAPTTSTVPGQVVTTTTRPTITTGPTTTSTIATSTTTEEAPGPFEYAVVAEEDARRLAVIEPGLECPDVDEACEIEPTMRVDLDERPHNLASRGSVVYATHPAAGSISRADIAAGTVRTVEVGTEPHDIKFDPGTDLLYVADESGRTLLEVDPETLDLLKQVELPGEAHDLVVADGDIWVTLIGVDALARVQAGQVELFQTGGSPHDLIVDEAGMIWFSNWNSHTLNVFDPATGETTTAPAGVSEPHHFALDGSGSVWVSDNAGSAVIGFTSDPPVSIEVGPVPHHLAFVGGVLVVAVSGSGEAVLIADGEVVARAPLTPGLHGVTAATLDGPLGGGP